MSKIIAKPVLSKNGRLILVHANNLNVRIHKTIQSYAVKKAYNENSVIVFSSSELTNQRGYLKSHQFKIISADDEMLKKEMTQKSTKTPKKEAMQKKETNTPMQLMIQNSFNAKSSSLIFSELKWKILARNIIRNKNTMLIGPSGCGKTSIAIDVAKSLNRPAYVINMGSTQDPRSALIGQNQYSKERGTYFQESNFIKALETENCVIICDELSRAHPEAFNIVLPLLDFRSNLQIEENNRTVKVANGVSFIATANIGIEYTSTRTMDRALVDRFIPIEVDFISKEEELQLIKNTYNTISPKDADNIVSFIELIRMELNSESPRISTHISTRTALELAGLCADGINLYDAAVYTILPRFSQDGGADSERTYVLQVLQKFVSKDDLDDSIDNNDSDDSDDNSNDDSNSIIADGANHVITI